MDYEEKTAAIIIIGNEILSGRIQDTNSPFLCKELFELGIRVKRISTIPDDEKIIANEIKIFSDKYNLVFVTGGIGPTHDDVTMKSLAKGFQVELLPNTMLEKLFRLRMGKDFNPAWLKMTYIPQNAELIGIDDEHFPIIKCRNIYIFPGVPSILKEKFKWIAEAIKVKPIFRKEIELFTSEAKLVGILEKVVKQFSDISIGSYPNYETEENSVRLSMESKDKNRLEEAFLYLNSLLKLNNIL